MTREEAIHRLAFMQQYYTWRDGEVEAFEIAIEALKAQDRPIICPRCGRTFSEAEGRESKEKQGLEYAENILEDILREQERSEE